MAESVIHPLATRDACVDRLLEEVLNDDHVVNPDTGHDEADESTNRIKGQSQVTHHTKGKDDGKHYDDEGASAHNNSRVHAAVGPTLDKRHAKNEDDGHDRHDKEHRINLDESSNLIVYRSGGEHIDVSQAG